MRCPDCSKFVSFDESDPEVEDENPELDSGGGISTTVRIVNTCADCNTELKEATFDVQVDFNQELIAEHQGEGHQLEVSIEDASRATDQSPKPKQVKDRKTGQMVTRYPNPRFVKTLYGFDAVAVLRCSCKPTATLDDDLQRIDISDYISASGMDEMV